MSIELSCKVEEICQKVGLEKNKRAELKGSADLLTGKLLIRQHQTLVLPRGNLCFLSWPWLESKGDWIRYDNDDDQIRMLGKLETLPRDFGSCAHHCPCVNTSCSNSESD